MEKIILENIKWIFSGFGVLVIVGLWRYFNRPRKRKPETTVTGSHNGAIQQPPGADTAVPSPAQIIDPIEVVRIISAAPLLQQDSIAKHYEGIRVDWTGELRYMAMWPDNKLRVDIEMWSKDPSLGHASITFYIGPTEYAGLGLLKKGDPIRVSGVIEHASSVGFILKDAKLISYGSGHQ